MEIKFLVKTTDGWQICTTLGEINSVNKNLITESTYTFLKTLEFVDSFIVDLRNFRAWLGLNVEGLDIERKIICSNYFEEVYKDADPWEVSHVVEEVAGDNVKIIQEAVHAIDKADPIFQDESSNPLSKFCEKYSIPKILRAYIEELVISNFVRIDNRSDDLLSIESHGYWGSRIVIRGKVTKNQLHEFIEKEYTNLAARMSQITDGIPNLSLSNKDYKIYKMYKEGLTVREIEERLDGETSTSRDTYKNINQAIGRIRKKVNRLHKLSSTT